MSRGRAWSLAFLVGVVALFGTSLAAYLPLILALLLAGAGVFRYRLAGLSGVLVGFGATATWLIGWQFATGGHYDQGPIVFAFGLVPFAIGVVLGIDGARDR